MPQRVYRSFFVDTGGFQCFAKNDLNAAIAYRCCGVGHVFAAMAGRREYPDLEKQVNIVEELRDILRFKRADGKPILRQRPPWSTIKDASQIDERLKEFRQQLQTRTTGNDPVIVGSSEIIIDYLDKYSDRLIGHLIILSGSNQVILLDRTNIQNDINHCAYLHSILQAKSYMVVAKSTIQRVNTQFIMGLSGFPNTNLTNNYY